MESVLHTRDADGGHLVRVLPDDGGYELVRPSGSVVFPSKRQLLIEVTGHPTGRNWTFGRYFREGRGLVGRPAATTLDWFLEGTGIDHRPVTGCVPGTRVRSDESLSVSESTAARLALVAAGELPEAQVELGIDLVNRSHEVAKLLFAGFGTWIYSSGYDPEDVLQEVYMGILARNAGKCPWDQRKSSFGHYVHMVCRGVMSNYHRKVKRVRDNESPGVLGFDASGDLRVMDVASANLPAPVEGDVDRRGVLEATEELLEFIPEEPGTELVRQVIPYLRDGYTRTDIARLLGVSRTLVIQAVVELQEWAADWRRTW